MQTTALRDLVVRKRFGIPASLTSAILIWLFGAVFGICRFIDYPAVVSQTVTSGCVSDSLIGWTLSHDNWPYALGYWEPYWVPELIGIPAMAVWSGISLLLKRSRNSIPNYDEIISQKRGRDLVPE